jgi:hypothetical protein
VPVTTDGRGRPALSAPPPPHEVQSFQWPQRAYLIAQIDKMLRLLSADGLADES